MFRSSKIPLSINQLTSSKTSPLLQNFSSAMAPSRLDRLVFRSHIGFYVLWYWNPKNFRGYHRLAKLGAHEVGYKEKGWTKGGQSLDLALSVL